MGLSKKLGGASQKVPASPVVPYKWSNQTYTVAEILKKFKLPCVVQCATDDSCTVVWSDFQFDLRQPILLYSLRSVQKVHAVSLQQTNDILEEIGPPLAIPADYEGWFGASPKGLNKAKRHFRIESIVNSTTRRFLVTTKCPAFTTSHDHEGTLHHVPHDVMPGEILRRVCLLDWDPDDPDCPDLVKQHGPCLECLDEKDEAVVIPLSYATLSYEIADSYPDEESKVFQIPSLVEAGNTKLPRILTLIHGDPPLLAYAFTGMVRCYSVFNEETLLAATLEDPGSRCLELITDSSVRFRLGLNEVAVKKTCEYTGAFQMCENFGAKFVTKIKVAFTLKPEISDSGVVDVSTSESTSDMQDVAANSEFDITWGSVKKAKLAMAPSFPRPYVSSEIIAAVAATAAGPVMETTAPTETLALSGDSSPADSKTGGIEIPQHRDFTEQEIVKLMLKKGMMESTAIVNEVYVEDELNASSEEHEANEASVEAEANEASVEASEVLVDRGSSCENRVTDNPLFYFFQRHPEQNPWKPVEPTGEDPAESEDETASDDCQEENVSVQKRDENPLGYLFTQQPTSASSQSEVKNPLSHLFEPMSNQIFPDKESRVNTNKDDGAVSVYSHHSAPSVEHESEFSHYNQLACKTARAYNGSDNDDDDNDDEDDDEDDDEVDEEEDCCSDSDDISEMAEPSGIRKELYNEESVHLPIPNNFTDGRNSHIQNRPYLEIRGKHLTGSQSNDGNYAPPITHLNKSPTSNHEINTGDGSSDMGVASEEEAVRDLLTLVDMETSRDSSNNAAQSSQWAPVRDSSTSGLSENQQKTTFKSDTVRRLNTLLEEVSETVSKSSDQVMDSNKDLRNINTVYNNSTNTSIQRDGYSKWVPKTADNNGTYSGEHNNSGSISEPSGHYRRSVEGISQIVHAPQPHLDGVRFSGGDLTSTFDDRFNSRLTNSKSETSTHVFQRSKTRGNLPQIDQEGIHQLEARKLHNTKPRQASLSSIFSIIQRQTTNSHNSEINSHSNDHSGMDNTELDHCEDEFSSSSTLNGDRKYSFPYKNQRVLSLTRGNLASFQNLDRLHSSNDSSSSNRSSDSMDNSFSPSVQGVRRLVVIGDNDLIIQDQMSNANGHHRDVIDVQQSHEYPSGQSLSGFSTVESNEEEFKTPDRYAVSNSGRFRTNKLTRAHTNLLHIDNEDEFLNEDYV